ncbi:MAG: succinate dehydrogenase, hydrophobic membrane anchor protein [Pseudomonadota bacterium]
MRYATDRKRVSGLGSGRDGTRHHWQMMVSSILLCFAIPALVVILASAIGGSYADVTAYFAQPGIALITILSLAVVVWHTMQEVLEALEDYVHGTAGKLSMVAAKAIGYGLIAAGIFAIVRMAL